MKNIKHRKEIIELYSVKLLSMPDIGKKLGISRQRVHQILNEENISRTPRQSKKTLYIRHCIYCNKIIIASYKNKKYCNSKCFGAKYFTGTRKYLSKSKKVCATIKARKIIKAKKGEVVHHIDGNIFNNKLSNLMVFKNNSEHLKFHYRQQTISG